jgi:uridine kinase
MLVGLCGRAGSGKTTLGNKITEELKRENISTVCYSGDLRFTFDSETRGKWLNEKWRVGFSEYLKAVNQFNWWNFEKIQCDLQKLGEGQAFVIEGGYDRKTGNKNLHITFPQTTQGIILYENCVLGGIELLEQLDAIVLLNTPEKLCLERLIVKDSNRRNLTSVMTRFLVTTYSENIFFNMLLDKFMGRVVACDSEGHVGQFPNIEAVTHVPVPIPTIEQEPMRKGTVFLDLDGTLIKHVAVPSESGEEIQVLKGSADKVKEWRKKSYLLVLCTSRQCSKTFGILDRLKAEGMVFDQIICDLPVGPRILINDSKLDEVRAFAVALSRNAGVASVELP